MTLETTINLMDIITAGIVLLSVIATIGFILLLLRQLRHFRLDSFYRNMIRLESELNKNNKDLWGIPENNKIKYFDHTDQEQEIEISVEKLRYFVCFLECYAANRQLLRRRKRVKEYGGDSLIYKMFKDPRNKRYRKYWEAVVRKRFYNTKGKFVKAIDKTLERIREEERNQTP